MLYLAKGEVRESHYEGRTKTYEVTHLVEASDDKEAKDILTLYYEKQCSPYDVSFHVYGIDLNPVLTRDSVLS
jgi:hypothetical protein